MSSFLLLIILSVFRCITASDYHFGISQTFLAKESPLKHDPIINNTNDGIIYIHLFTASKLLYIRHRRQTMLTCYLNENHSDNLFFRYSK